MAADLNEFLQRMTPGEREYWDAYIEALARQAQRIIERVLDEPRGG